jgi:hypothetical protein
MPRATSHALSFEARMRIASIVSALLSRIGPIEPDQLYRCLYLLDVLLCRQNEPPTGLAYNVKEGRLVAPLLQLHVYFRSTNDMQKRGTPLLMSGVRVTYNHGRIVLSLDDGEWHENFGLSPVTYGMLEWVIRLTRAGQLSTSTLMSYDDQGYLKHFLAKRDARKPLTFS